MPNPFQTITNAMDPTAPKPKPAPKAAPPTKSAGAPVTTSTERSKDPKIQAEIKKRMAAQAAADALAKKKPFSDPTKGDYMYGSGGPEADKAWRDRAAAASKKPK